MAQGLIQFHRALYGPRHLWRGTPGRRAKFLGFSKRKAVRMLVARRQDCRRSRLADMTLLCGSMAVGWRIIASNPTSRKDALLEDQPQAFYIIDVVVQNAGRTG